MGLRLCHIDDIDDGDSRGFDPNNSGRDVFFVIRRGRRAFAWRNQCPHRGYEGTKMAWRRHRYISGDGLHIFCAAHGARFDMVSGVCIRGPCLGEVLIPEDVRVDLNGDLQWYPQQE